MKKERVNASFKLTVIGIIRSAYHTMNNVPIQGIFNPESKGTLEVFDKYEEGLKDIENFSHLILIYIFHKSKGYNLICRPYLEEKNHGVFAMRAPKRPNQIGLSVVRLLERKGRKLHLSEVDTLDGTPVLDIKPLIPEFDFRENVRTGWCEEILRHKKFRKFSDDRF
jgi:tRNA-Thr(GGU) m(6)t(6)A37 methyltransferase TsaA